MSFKNKKGVLLVNLGSPSQPEVKAIRKYLRQFLSDPRVLTMPALGRWMLLNLIILPFRPKKTAQNYKKIWQNKSPLILHSENLTQKVSKILGEDYQVALTMRYGEPSLEKALRNFVQQGITEIILAPLYPQYASSTTGSTIEEVFRILKTEKNIPSLQVVPPYYDHPDFIQSWVSVGRKHLKQKHDHILFSFHGLPEQHVVDSDPTKSHCLKSENCCQSIGPHNAYCYRAQCYQTASLIAKELQLNAEDYTVSFQSRLGRTPWIKPYTTDTISDLGKQGKKRLLVFCPAFVADCLETLEEIAIGEREVFLNSGGEELILIPSLNNEDIWAETLSKLIQERR